MVRGSRRDRAFIGITVLAAVLLLAAGASMVAPLSVTCPPELGDSSCKETVAASMERGLPPFHPLVLAARVVPGEAGVGQYGLRAIITFDLLGVPGPTDVRLHYDIGGNWGGPPSRRGPELAAWALLAAAVLVGAVALIVGLASRVIRRGRGAPTGDPEVPSVPT